LQVLLIFSRHPVESVYIVDYSRPLIDSNEESKVLEGLLDRHERDSFAVCLGRSRSTATNDLLVYKTKSDWKKKTRQ
jgi:hypothetical protein